MVKNQWKGHLWRKALAEIVGWSHDNSGRAAGKNELTVRFLAKADVAVKPNFHGIIKSVRRLDGAKVSNVSCDEYGLHISTDMVSDERPIVFEIKID